MSGRLVHDGSDNGAHAIGPIVPLKGLMAYMYVARSVCSRNASEPCCAPWPPQASDPSPWKWKILALSLVGDCTSVIGAAGS